MCVKVDFDLRNKYSKSHNNVSFNGFTPMKDNYGKRIYEFNYPYDSNRFDCYLEVCSVITDDYGNYIVVEGLKNRKSKDGYLKLDPSGSKVNLSQTFGLMDDEPFAYHYALYPKNTPRETPGVYPIYKIDMGNFIDSSATNGDHEIYNIVTGSNPKGYMGGSMKLLMPDFYNPMWTYDDSGRIVENKNYKNLVNSAKTFSNKIGGNLAGLEKDVRDGKFNAYTRIISTPLFTDDSLSSHAYWNKNCMQIAQSLGNINNYASLQREMFKKGINFVSDGAYVNEGLEGIHFKHVLKWGDQSPYFEWFKATNMKNGPLMLGVFSKNNDFIRHKLVNSPYSYKQDLKSGKIHISRNSSYDSKKPTYIQIYDDRLVSDKLKKDTKNLIKAYDILNTSNKLDINTHDDTVMPYAFEINPETYKKNIEVLNEYNSNLKNKDFDLYKTFNNAINIVFPSTTDSKKLELIKSKIEDAIDKVEAENDSLKYNTEVDMVINEAANQLKSQLSSEEKQKLTDTVKKLKNTIPLDSYLGTRFVSKFENFELEEKIEGKFNTWDANTDIGKLNYLYSNDDLATVRLNYDLPDQTDAKEKIEQKSFEVQDYAITSARYWTAKTNDILNLHVAQQLKFTPEEMNDLRAIYSRILQNIDAGNFPQKLESVINVDVVKHVLDKKYNFKSPSIAPEKDLEYKQYLLASLMNLPLDTIEFGDNLTAVLASPYITKRATDDETVGKTRFDMFVNKNPHLKPEYAATYNKMDAIYQKELYNFAYEIISNLNDMMPENSKIFKTYNTTNYGWYVLPIISDIIVKYAFVKALSPQTGLTANEKTGEITYDYNSLKNTTLESLGIIAASPEDEAKQVLNKLQSGIKKISNDDKKELVNILFNTLKGTNEASFKFAEVITDRLNAGLDWRIDAAKDIGDMDGLRKGSETIDNVWPKVTKFWEKFTDSVYFENPNSYIVAEITDEGTLHSKGHGSESRKYHSPQDMVTKFIRESNMTSLANYSSFYSSILNLFARHFDKNDKQGGDGFHTDLSHRMHDKLIGPDGNGGFLKDLPLLSIINAYNFIGNHDKPRILHGLIINTDWYTTDLNDPNNYYFRNLAYRILNNVHTDKLLNNANYSDETYSKAEKTAVAAQDFKHASVKALAMSEALYEAFQKSIDSIYPINSDANLNKKIKEPIYQSISDLANGTYKGKTIQADGFGVKPLDIAIDIVLDQAKSEHNLNNISQAEVDKLKTKTFQEALEPALKKLQAMMDVLTVMPGMPTLYAGDDLGATGYESESKNIYLQNRSIIHNEWLDPNNKDYKFIQDHYKAIDEIMAQRNRPELHALNDGAPFALDIQHGSVDGKQIDVSAILRQGSDNSFVISLINTSGVSQYFKHNYDVRPVELERIDLRNSEEKAPRFLTKGLTPGMILYNAKNKNDRYIVKEYNGNYFIKRLVRGDNGQDYDEKIVINDTVLTLYSEPPENTQESSEAVKRKKQIYNKQFHFNPINNGYKKFDTGNLGRNLSLVSNV